jgi:PAS domain-containing protein
MIIKTLEDCIVTEYLTDKSINGLEKTKKLFYTFIDSSRDLIFLKDDNFRHIIANQALADFYGIALSDLIGKTDYDLMHIENAEKCHKTDVEALSNCKLNSSIEIVNDRIYETRKFSVPLEDGRTGAGRAGWLHR